MDSAKDIFKKHFDKQSEVVSGNDLHWINLKFKHSYDVLEIAELLLEKDNELKFMKEDYIVYGKIAALLHDIGRFYEVADARKGFKHGKFGAENILKNEEHIKNPFILLPIKYHDQKNISEEFFEDLATYNLNKNEEEVVLKLLKLVRDSDKLANLRMHENFIDDIFVFFLDKKLCFTDSCLKAFKNKELVNNKERNTVFDQILGYMCWVYDLQLQYSKELIFDENFLNAHFKIIEKKIDSISNYDKNDLNNFLLEVESLKKQLILDRFLRA